MSTESTQELRARLRHRDGVEDLIRRRAYEISLLRGGRPGDPREDWFRAENEVLSLLVEQESRPIDPHALLEPSEQAMEFGGVIEPEIGTPVDAPAAFAPAPDAAPPAKKPRAASTKKAATVSGAKKPAAKTAAKPAATRKSPGTTETAAKKPARKSSKSQPEV